jgi:hypothetical protein
LLSDYFSLSDKRIDFQKVADKNFEGAKELEKTYVWGAMYAIDRNIAIEQKRKKTGAGLLKYKAKLYEKLAIDAESKSNRACVSFAEKAGLNLRNAVAHSLMDVFEYSFEQVVVLFCIIIKLSKYTFIETKGDTNDSSSK